MLMKYMVVSMFHPSSNPKTDIRYADINYRSVYSQIVTGFNCFPYSLNVIDDGFTYITVTKNKISNIL